MRPAAVLLALLATLSLLHACFGHAFAEEVSPAAIDFFERRIRPVLVEHCLECHGQDGEGGLRLDSREAMRRGGESGPAVLPGQPAESLLLRAIRYESLEMPPDQKLPPRVVADFEKWIAGGAVDPRTETAGATRETPQPTPDGAEARQFWSFQAPRRHALPAAAAENWCRQPLDAFILARLRQAELAPNPEADRRTLIRRVTFDLTGLPPTPAEVEAFVQDAAPDAYERLVQRLLGSPRYGERWARMWLDLARYAEDQAHIVGDNSSLFYPNAYLYRDWVIEALNEDLAYDDFVRQQLAADLLLPNQRDEHVALGFIGLGPKYYRRSAPEVMADEWEDRVDTVSRGLLGLTVACARCHDHKYDPISTKDYYALAGVFASTEMFNRPLDQQRETGKEGQAKKPADAMHIVRDKEPRDLHVFIRGDVKKQGPLAERRFLRVLCKGEPQRFQEGSGRLELAEAIASDENPLTARVIVNRVWALLFGQPLVGSPSNFGNLGEEPTHPELLDDLAVRFMAEDWSLKWLQREMVLSAAYRQSSDRHATGDQVDVANRLLWRMNRRRLSVEAWRDAILAASSQLDFRIGGPSIQPQDPDARRRTVYAHVSRLDLDSMLAMFDFPDPNVHAAKRVETTTPLQKLFVLNSPFMVQQARALATELLRSSAEQTKRIEHAYLRLYGRPPSETELQLASAFLEQLSQSNKPLDCWSQYAQVLLASNELLMID